MTEVLRAKEVAEKVEQQFPGAVIEYSETTVLVDSRSIHDVCQFLNQASGLDFDYLVNLTGVDYLDYLEVVYHLVSMKHNHRVVLKTRCYDRERPSVPSVTPIWRGADLQEREAYDLLGIRFEGHPNLKRIVLWEGFEGHPLRRDYL